MKKLLLMLAAATLSASAVNAQLSDGSVAPDFTVKDLNGNSHNLYSILASGKTVFIDVSAAWCAPCWSYHNSGALENLYAQHGPTGASGVNSSTTNDVMVIMIEGESTNTKAQLYGPAASTGSYATTTQGDWVTGTPYPIVDSNSSWTSSFNTAWKIGYFPTVYMICRDRLVREVGQLSTSALYAASQANCPTYAPSATVDAKAVPYSGTAAFVCNANPTIKFQNYSTTNSISSATIKTYSGSTLVNTYNWTGTAIPPYGVASVTIPAFAGTNFTPYKYEVVVAGDSYAANNTSKDSLYKVYAAGNAVSTPWKENFQTSANLPFRMASSAPELRVFTSSGSYVLKGIDGNGTSGLMFPFPEVAAATVVEAVIGNFNTGSAANVALEFDLSHANASGKTDKLEVLGSNNCGANWTSLWSKSGAALGTTPSPASGAFVPTTGAMWRHETVSLNAVKGTNMVIKIVGTGNAGHYAFVDNLKITNTTNVSNVITEGSVALYPNPAKDAATLDFTLAKSGKVVINVLDATGRTVAVAADATMAQGAQHITISTAGIAAGVYNINIQTEEGVHTQRLTVVK
jgi:hypothetical protein